MHVYTPIRRLQSSTVTYSSYYLDIGSFTIYISMIVTTLVYVSIDVIVLTITLILMCKAVIYTYLLLPNT